MGNIHAGAAFGFRFLFANPRMYARVGLDPKAAYRAAITNPHHLRRSRTGSAISGRFLDSVGLMGSFARRSWKKCGVPRVRGAPLPVTARRPRVAVVGGAAIQGVGGTVVAPDAVRGLRFRPDRDAWTLTTATGETDYDLVVLDGAHADVVVPALDPRVTPPSSVGPADASAPPTWACWWMACRISFC